MSRHVSKRLKEMAEQRGDVEFKQMANRVDRENAGMGCMIIILMGIIVTLTLILIL